MTIRFSNEKGKENQFEKNQSLLFWSCGSGSGSGSGSGGGGEDNTHSENPIEGADVASTKKRRMAP
jgi:hypothetical protein